ncbi:MAG: hypothetical protein R2762_07110 [Bryobacteraceae bacterium]
MQRSYEVRIFQKQELVDIPQIETRGLRATTRTALGFEIYSSLTRWNPLNLWRPMPKASTGYKVLVVGLGPAGFTLVHHLMNDGRRCHRYRRTEDRTVAGRDPGVDPYGRCVPFQLIRDVNELYENLNDRVLAGFGSGWSTE